MKPVRIILFGLVCGIVSTAHADIASVQYVQSIISSLEPPTVNNAVLTIQKNGTTVDTFTANASVDKAINITVPTTAADVGAVPTSRTVNSKALSSDITLTASDVGADATGTAAGLVGTLSNLTTTDKTNVVAAINEVKSSIGNIDTGVESVTEGTANGTIKVDGTDVAVHGLGTAAYTASTDYVPTSRTVNGEALSSNVTLDGADIALTGYSKPASTSAIAAADTINAAIGKLETALDGKQASGSYVPTTTTVAGHALSSNVTLSNSDVGLGNVQNVDQTNAANITSGTMS
ncbi:MAG: hypothetical protein J6W40_05090, partial [Alphaproteobacteria bacterium]|nr:hypothetical protein [Alphaproteobacteria bacterium]